MSKYVSKAMAIEKEMLELAQKLAELKQQAEELNTVDADKQLAEDLHHSYCTSNHTDKCGWYWESWDNGPTRKGWLHRVELLKQHAAEVGKPPVEVLVEYDKITQILKGWL